MVYNGKSYWNEKKGYPYFTKPPICLVVSFMDHHHDVSLLVMCFYSYIKYYDRCQRILKRSMFNHY